MKEIDLLDHYNKNLDYHSVDHWQVLTLVNAPKTNMLDVGCGTGRACEWSEKYVGFDPAYERINLARQLWPKKMFIYGTWQKLVVGLNQFDLVYCAEVLEHLDDPVGCVQAMKRATKDMLVCTVPINMPYKAHLHVYKTHEDLKRFEPHTIRQIKNHFVFTWRKHDDLS